MNQICPNFSCKLHYHELNHHYVSRQMYSGLCYVGCLSSENKVFLPIQILTIHWVWYVPLQNRTCFDKYGWSMFACILRYHPCRLSLNKECLNSPTNVRFNTAVVSTKMGLKSRPGEPIYISDLRNFLIVNFVTSTYFHINQSTLNATSNISSTIVPLQDQNAIRCWAEDKNWKNI